MVRQQYLHYYILLAAVTSIFVTSLIMQSYFFLNVDVAWLLEASKRMMYGQTYSKGFFDNNPPLILYLYLFPVIASELFHISIINSLFGFVYLLSLLCFSICYVLIKNIYQDNQVSPTLWVILLTFLMWLLPTYEFGQREHLTIMLTLPYFLLMACRVLNLPVNERLVLLVALLAAIGFCLKPYFLFPLIFAELYFISVKNSVAAAIRKETIIIFEFLIAYLLLIFFRHPDYLFIVVPYALDWGYLGTKLPTIILLSFPPILVCILPLLFLLKRPLYLPERRLIEIFAVALSGFLLSYLMQGTLYSYHFLPVIVFANLLNLVMVDYYIRKPQLQLKEYSLLSAVGLLAILLYYNYMGAMWTFMPFFVTTSLLVLAFAFFAVPRQLDRIIKRLYVGMLAVVIFSFPTFYTYFTFKIFKARMLQLTKLIEFQKQYVKGESVYFFGNSLNAYPLAYYTGIKSESRFQFLWMLPALYKFKYLYGNQFESKQLQGKNYLIRMITEDIERYKPKYIFVDELEKKSYFFNFDQTGFHYLPFNYLDYFNDSPLFRTEWANYKYFTTVESKVESTTHWGYKFAVYRRVN